MCKGVVTSVYLKGEMTPSKGPVFKHEHVFILVPIHFFCFIQEKQKTVMILSRELQGLVGYFHRSLHFLPFPLHSPLCKSGVRHFTTQLSRGQKS